MIQYTEEQLQAAISAQQKTPNPKYLSTKTYGNDRGLSCCFRQWRSTHSHCSLLHGYSIGIKLIFESETLDDRNWVMDFGGLKAFKEWADWQFDHTLCVGSDDPHLEKFKTLAALGKQADGGVVDLRVVEAVGCEKFAELAYRTMNEILQAYQAGTGWTHPDGRVFEARYPVGVGVKLRSAEVFEHAGNSAIYEG
jgi:6-pyruvoyltetrahydropterin/6-carboxytetrahydropterin synthase